MSAQQLLVLTESTERELIRALAAFPEEIMAAAKNYDPARLTHYAIDVATRFHKFYNACRCKVDDENLMQARLALCLATGQTLKNVLTMLRIDVPETM